MKRRSARAKIIAVLSETLMAILHSFSIHTTTDEGHLGMSPGS